jgi:uncharacterized protein (TIGR02118 family)
MPKLIVMYPQPTDTAAFDARFKDEHLPMAGDCFKRAKGLNALRGVLSPTTVKPEYHALAILEYASLADLRVDVSSEGAQKAVGHAVEISTGGPPVFLVCEDFA